MDKVAHVTDIMTDKVITIAPETSISEIIKMLTKHKFNGLPVVDKENKLLGLVTEYNLLNRQTLVTSFLENKWDQLTTDVKNLANNTAEQIMETKPLTLLFTDTYEEALALFNKHHRINPVPVVDEDNKLVGIVSRYDLLKLLRLYGHT